MPDITLLEIQQRLIANCGERFSVSVLWRFFDRHGITFKKTAHAQDTPKIRPRYAHEQSRADVLKQRQDWFAGRTGSPAGLVRRQDWFAGRTGSPGSSISIRRSSFSLTKPGLPPILRVKGGAAGKEGGCAWAFRTAITRRSRWSPVFALGSKSPRVYDRPINAALFEEWVEKRLIPALAPGDVVVMDNLSSHKGPRVEQLIEAAGAKQRYPPPYSPDMNRNEKARSKLKAFLRKIARSEPSRA